MAGDVLVLAEHRIATVSLLEQLLAYLEKSAGVHARTRLLHELRATDITPDTFPLIVRACSPFASRLARTFRRHGIPYGFYLDDNFWLLDPETPLGRHYGARSTRRRLDSIVRGATTVVTSTAPLRDYVRSTLNPRAIHLDAAVDFSLFPELPPLSHDHPVIRGGFAGSTSRVGDLVEVFTDVLRILDERDDVEFEIIGVGDGELALRHPRLRTFPHVPSYEEYVEFQRSREWDFGLAPLGPAASNLYKTNNKYREYGAQGIPGVYQESAAYGAVVDGATGLLVGRTRSWHDAIERYVTDPGLRATVRRDARRDVERRYAPAAVTPAWADFLSSAPTVGDAPSSMSAIRRALARESSLTWRAALRLRVLVANAREEFRERGLRSALRRSLRFVRARVVRR